MKYFCVNCGISIKINSLLCFDCICKLPIIHKTSCCVCGNPLISEQKICMLCRTKEYLFKENISVFQYAGAVPVIIRALKIWKLPQAAKLISKYFSDIIASKFNDYMIVPVPCRKDKIKREGFDQMKAISRYLEKKFSVCYALKRKSGIAQKGLGSAERINNINGAISCCKLIINDKILLIDDVFTTGSTLNECARILNQKGAVTISCLTFARD